MIRRITEFFSNNLAISQTAEPQNSRHPLQLAAAALMLEVSRADFNVEQSERDALNSLLKQQFQLSAQELATLVELAQQEAEQATSLYQFTRLINDNYSPQQKRQLVQNLWQLALADGYLDKHEDHLIRKVADLIHLPHKDFIGSKLDAIELSSS